MALAPTKPRDVDLPAAFKANAQKDGAARYPTGNTAGNPIKQRQYAQYTRALWDEQDEYYAELGRVWTQNLLFLSNRQWWVPTRDPNNPFRPPRVPPWKEMPVTNLTMAFFRTYLAKVLKNRPAWVVMPASTDPDDVHSAETGDQVLEAKWLELRLDRVLRMAVSWTLATGDGFLYPYWNSRTGRMVEASAYIDVPVYDAEGNQTGEEEALVKLDKRGEPILLANGRPDEGAEGAWVDEGDLGVRAFSPWQVRVNPEAETDDDLEWVIISETRSLRELAISHPDLVDKIIPEDVSRVTMDAAYASLGAVLGVRQSPVDDTRDRDLDKVLVLHYHEKPCPEYPKGRYWQTAGEKIVLEEPQDLPEGIWPPVVHLQDIMLPGRYHSASVVENVIPLNKRYNEINAAIREHHNLMSKGKWLVPRGSGLRQGSISNAPGEVLQYNPGFKPEQAQVAPVPPSLMDEREQVYSDFQIVSSMHSVSMGKAPPGISAGVAMLQLQEADDTDLNPFLTMLENAVAQLAGAALRIIRERYTTERLIDVVGPNQKYQVRAFKGSDLNGVRDVRPQAGSSFPWNKMAQQSMLLTLAAQMPQLFTNPETGQFDSAKFARMLPVGGLSALGNDSDLDVQEALREEEMFTLLGAGNNEVPQVESWQNHEVHYLQHIRILKSAGYRDWTAQAKQAFIEHVEATQAKRDEKAAQMAQMQAMAQGNAPKELYQQGGPVGTDTAGPGAQAPPEVADMSPEELAALDGLDQPPWLEEEIAASQAPAF